MAKTVNYMCGIKFKSFYNKMGVEGGLIVTVLAIHFIQHILLGFEIVYNIYERSTTEFSIFGSIIGSMFVKYISFSIYSRDAHCHV